VLRGIDEGCFGNEFQIRLTEYDAICENRLFLFKKYRMGSLERFSKVLSE
jgi:hypothetical protein